MMGNNRYPNCSREKTSVYCTVCEVRAACLACARNVGTDTGGAGYTDDSAHFIRCSEQMSPFTMTS